MKYYVGIDLGGTDIKAGVIDEGFNIVAKHVVPTNPGRLVDEIVADMADAGKTAVKMAGLAESDIIYVGVGIPGAVNSKTNIIILTPNVGWKNVDFIPIFKKYWDIPVFLGNDADAAALAEVYAGAARGYDNVVVLTLGTGVGGGFVFDKKIFTGGGFGTEPGHIIIVADGEPCGCGARGCLEAYASVTALIREAKQIMAEHPDSLLHTLCEGDSSRVNGKIIFDAAKQDDTAAKAIVSDYVKYLGAGIASFCNALRPQAIILGGGVCNAGEPLFAPLDKIVESLIFSTGDGEIPPILRAELGNDAGIIGAALFGIGS
ncbi:MAG: ROK family protein [Oscillospiraceae bacterium]|nr:ROK family protein [Oscillospiraceae bacterium]